MRGFPRAEDTKLVFHAGTHLQTAWLINGRFRLQVSVFIQARGEVP